MNKNTVNSVTSGHISVALGSPHLYICYLRDSQVAVNANGSVRIGVLCIHLPTM